MSDDRLRKLERAWAADGNGETAVAYLSELLRAGKISQIEARLAWRVARLEWALDTESQNRRVEGVSPHGGPFLNITFGGPFRPEEQIVAFSVLGVIFGESAPALSGPENAGAIGDIVRAILVEEWRIRSPLHPGELSDSRPVFGATGPLRCTPDRHFGPVEYDAGGPPFCTRCGAAVNQEGPMQNARVSGCSHLATFESSRGTACSHCGEVLRGAWTFE